MDQLLDDWFAEFDRLSKAIARYAGEIDVPSTEPERIFSDLCEYLSVALVNNGDVFGYISYIAKHESDFRAIGAEGTLQALAELMPYYREQQECTNETKGDYWRRTKETRESAEEHAEGCLEFSKLLLDYAVRNLPEISEKLARNDRARLARQGKLPREPMPLPRLLRVRQRFPRPRVDDVPAAVNAALGKLSLASKIKPRQSVALTAGSRGIANIPVILKSVVEHVRGLGATPYIVPAMGSHGGGTADGQRAVLESYGITEAIVGCPIHASMEVVEIGKTPEGWPVYLDKISSQADHIGVVVRVKPHTSYHGPIESGWMKMMMIGLGKHVGAAWYHRVLLENVYDDVVRSVGRVMRAKAPISFGLAAVENAYDDTALIEAALPADFEPVEERLLVKAREWLPRLPFREADLLIIDEIGKEISGSGMDTNVVGRKRAFKTGAPEGQPQMRFIFIRGLSDHTHGNACGIGFADFTTTRLLESMNYNATRINCVTSGYPEGANVPVHFDSDREVIDAALRIIGTRDPEQARIMRIRSTMKVEEVEVSETCLQTLPPQTEFDVFGDAEWTFDAAGNLPPMKPAV